MTLLFNQEIGLFKVYCVCVRGYMCVCVRARVCVHAQSCLTLCDSMDCSPSGSSSIGSFQARILEWVAISSFRGPSGLRD